MAEIHRMFRAGFGEGPALVAGVAEGDAAHADIVGDYLTMLSSGCTRTTKAKTPCSGTASRAALPRARRTSRG